MKKRRGEEREGVDRVGGNRRCLLKVSSRSNPNRSSRQRDRPDARRISALRFHPVGQRNDGHALASCPCALFEVELMFLQCAQIG